VNDDEKAVDGALLLVPISFITDDTTGKLTAKPHMRQAVEISDARATFYRTLLNRRWLSPALRRAVMKELGLSLRQHNRDFEDGGTVMMLHLIEERKAAIRARGLRPRGGIHEAAVGEIARQQGMTANTLKQRLKRYRQRRPGKSGVQ
jgi:hypothetical protein